MNDAPILLIKDLYKSYDSKVVLDDIDLQVVKGEFCTLVGPSGCGKSTLLRLVLGQERPSSGMLLINGQPAGFPDSRRGIVYQKYSLFPHLTAEQNVLLGARLSRPVFASPHAEVREKAYHLLRRVGLFDARKKYPHELSGGMQQRVAIVQSLMQEPEILLLDEPFSALDPGTREDLQMLLLEIHEEKHMTILFVTHDLEEAVFVGSRILVLSQYYSDDRGSMCPRGAKIVCDYDLHPELRGTSTKAKYTPRFSDMVKKIRQQGFDPAYLQHVTEFDLAHPDSFQTLTWEEIKDHLKPETA